MVTRAGLQHSEPIVANQIIKTHMAEYRHNARVGDFRNAASPRLIAANPRASRITSG